MKVQFDGIIDLGALGERPCHIAASIVSDGFWDSYHLVLQSVTTPYFGDLDISSGFTRQTRSEVEEEVIDAYKHELERLQEQQQERRAARGRVAVEAWA